MNLKTKKRGKKVATNEPEFKVVKTEQIVVEREDIKVKIDNIEQLSSLTINYLNAATEAVEQGLEDAFKVFQQIAKLNDTLQEVKKRLEAEAIDEASKFDKNSLKSLGWEIGYTASQYKYKDDPEVQRLEADLKERKKLVKIASQKGKYIDPDTGEVIEAVEEKPGRAYLRRRNPNK